ncbi:MAG: LysM domain-containing protein [Chloroflexota bacterium]|nr:LysM domain-containing protein [Chloroflexota bacterium]
MSDSEQALQALLQPLGMDSTAFPPTSRYHGIEVATMETSDGRTIAYVRRRFVPPPERFALLQEHTVQEGDRLDKLAAQYIGDPEQFWRLCDANGATRPDELTEENGRKLRITLPEGIPGGQNA